jgi:hypothetical protein
MRATTLAICFTASLLGGCGERSATGGTTDGSSGNGGSAGSTSGGSSGGTSAGMTTGTTGTTTGTTSSSTGGGTSGTSGSPSSSSTTGGTSGSTTGGVPMILSLAANTQTLHSDETLVFTAILTDSAGVDQVIGGHLVDPTSKASYGAFSTSPTKGAYSLTLTWEAINTVASIDAGAMGVTRTFRAEFFDQDSQSTSQDLVVTLRCAKDGDVAGSGSCSAGCFIDGQKRDPAALDHNNPCQSCQPNTTSDAWTLLADGASCGGGQICHAGACGSGCEVGSTHFAPGDADPQNVCGSCQPAHSTTSFSAVADGTPCGGGNICAGGACANDCVIGGQTYSNGVLDPLDACHICDPSHSVTSFTVRPDGTSCGGQSVCSAGACQVGCFIDNLIRAAEETDPANPCLICAPFGSTTGWSWNNGASCGLNCYCTNSIPTCETGGTSYCLHAGDGNGAECVDFNSDPINCGSCGNVCPEDHPVCGNGSCSIAVSNTTPGLQCTALCGVSGHSCSGAFVHVVDGAKSLDYPITCASTAGNYYDIAGEFYDFASLNCYCQ